MAYFVHRRSLLPLLLGIPFTACFLAAALVGVGCIFFEWRKRRWLSFLPLAVCIFLVVASGVIVRVIRHAIFVWSLPSYEAVVRQMESGKILVSNDWSRIPRAEAQARLVWAVFARKETNGVLTVEFFTETGFPMKHSGYLYTSSSVIALDALEESRWPFWKEERPHWFSISD